MVSKARLGDMPLMRRINASIARLSRRHQRVPTTAHSTNAMPPYVSLAKMTLKANKEKGKSAMMRMPNGSPAGPLIRGLSEPAKKSPHSSKQECVDCRSDVLGLHKFSHWRYQQFTSSHNDGTLTIASLPNTAQSSMNLIYREGLPEYLLCVIDLRSLQLVGIIHIHSFPRGEKVDRTQALAVSVAGVLDAAEG